MNWYLLLLVVITTYIEQVCTNKEIVAQINTRKIIQYLPERFLSITIDPITILAAGPLTQETLNMAKGLSPSFVRIGGKGTNILKFGKELMKHNKTVTESQWNSVNKFMQDAGLDLILSLNPTIRVRGMWDSSNSHDLIAYSEKQSFNVAWQLGYDLRTLNATSTEIGYDLMKLRKMLDESSKYSKTDMFGPDITSIRGGCQMQFLKNVLQEAGISVPSIIVQPEFHKNEESSLTISRTVTEVANYFWNRRGLGASLIPSSKPIWIAEPDASEGTFFEAMMLVKRLGAAAKSGCQIFFRQPGVTALKSPTPEYWTSLLYKTLVGRGVLETNLIKNYNNVHIFSHCTPYVTQDRSVLDSDWNYENSAITVFGVNESPEDVKVNLKASNKDEEIHIYVLTSGMNMEKHEYPETTLLNGQKLTMSPSNELPVLSPRRRQPSRTNVILIPPKSIFFLVLPNIKARTCSTVPLTTLMTDVQELTNRFKMLTSDAEKNGELEKSVYDTHNEQNVKPVYVSFTKRQINDPNLKKMDSISEKYKSLTKLLLPALPNKSIKNDEQKKEMKEDEIPVKYITFNDNSWLNKLKETMSSMKAPDQHDEVDSVTNEQNLEKIEKYAPLASAIMGIDKKQKDEEDKANLRLKRSSTVNPGTDTTSETDIDEQNVNRKRETIEISNLPENILGTLKQVQVTFTNLDDPKIMSDSDSDVTPKRIAVRHIDEAKINDETIKDKQFLQVHPNNEGILPEISSAEIVDNDDEVSSKEIVKEIVKEMSSEESDIIDSKIIQKEGSESVVNDKISTGLIEVGHIQKIKLKDSVEEILNSNDTMLTAPKVIEEMMTSPKEKIINNILSDIITKENNEQPPIITGIINDGTAIIDDSNSNSEHIFIPSQEMDIIVEEDTPKVQPRTDTNQETESITLKSISDPSELEEEITNSNKGEITSKVLRQVKDSNKEFLDLGTKSKINNDGVIVERLPGYISVREYDQSEQQFHERNSNATSITTKEIPQPNSKRFKIPLTPQDLKISPNGKLEERQETFESFKERLKETADKLKDLSDRAAVNEDILSSIKRREDELRNLFKKFDRKETHFSPYDTSRGIQFVTSGPVNDEMNSGYQFDTIKNRPRRLTHTVKGITPDYYEESLGMKSYHKLPNPDVNPSQNSQHMKYVQSSSLAHHDRTSYDIPKSQNQYLFPLNSKTQGIVYNNKIYPAKLFGIIDVGDQHVSNAKEYSSNNYKIKSDLLQYAGNYMRQNPERYSGIMEGYANVGLEQLPEHASNDRTKLASQEPGQRQINFEEPYIPVVILTQREHQSREDQYLPRTKPLGQKREILSNRYEENPFIESNQKLNRHKRNALFNPTENEIRERYKIRNKLKNNNREVYNPLIDTTISPIEHVKEKGKENLQDVSEIGVCKEVGTSKESIIVDFNNKMITPQHTTFKEAQIMETKNSPSEKKNHEDKTSTHHVFAMITDKFRNFIGYVHRIFQTEKY